MIAVREARPDDVPTLVALMGEFYAESGYPLPAAAAARTFATLLDDPRLGRVWLLEADGAPAGYVVLTVAFSMEFGGLRGFVDDLFVRPACRRRGLAAAALDAVRAAAGSLGVRALLVETGAEAYHAAARAAYARAGYTDAGRLLLTHPLAAAVHEG